MVGSIKMWYKILTGVIGIGFTLMWLVTMAIHSVGIAIDGVVAAGEVVFGVILLGNGYGLVCLLMSGLADFRQEYL